jgi:hypothetical protein
MSMFSAPTPGGGDKLPVADINAHFVIVHVTSYEENITTVNGPANAVRVNVADLSTGTHHLDVMWFPKVIVGSLRGQIGKTILAKVAQGVAQPGKSAPWILEDATGDTNVVAAAEKWMAANPGVLTGTPIAAPAPAPATPGLAASLI